MATDGPRERYFEMQWMPYMTFIVDALYRKGLGRRDKDGCYALTPRGWRAFERLRRGLPDYETEEPSGWQWVGAYVIGNGTPNAYARLFIVQRESNRADLESTLPPAAVRAIDAAVDDALEGVWPEPEPR